MMKPMTYSMNADMTALDEGSAEKNVRPRLRFRFGFTGNCGARSDAEHAAGTVAQHRGLARRRKIRDRAADLLRRLEIGIDMGIVAAPQDAVLADEIEHRSDGALFRLGHEVAVTPDVVARLER